MAQDFFVNFSEPSFPTASVAGGSHDCQMPIVDCRLPIGLLGNIPIGNLHSAIVRPTRYRACVKTQKFGKSWDKKSFDAIEKSFTGQIWPKIFSSTFLSRVFPQPLPRGGTDFIAYRAPLFSVLLSSVLFCYSPRIPRNDRTSSAVLEALTNCLV